MNRPEGFDLGPADATIASREGDTWTLVLVREVNHPPEKVWDALTDPAQLREWAPFDSDRNLGSMGQVRLTTFGAPKAPVAETEVTRAEPPKLLEYKWGGGDLRWELETTAKGTRLTLWAGIDHRFIAMGAAGWHVCLAVLDRLLGDSPVGRIAGPEAMQFEGWQRLNAEYSQDFGVKAPAW